MSVVEQLWDQSSFDEAITFFNPKMDEVEAVAVFAHIGSDNEQIGIQAQLEELGIEDTLHLSVFLQGTNEQVLPKMELLELQRRQWLREHINPQRYLDLHQFVLPYYAFGNQTLRTVEEFMREFHMDNGLHVQIYPRTDQFAK